jgi:hypothetical protein
VSASSFTTDTATEIDLPIPAGATGLVDVTVTTAGDTSATSTADHFTYLTAGGASTVGLYATTGSTFFLRNSADTGFANTTVTYQPNSSDTFVSIAGDWNGDGSATIGVYDHTNGTFYLRNSNAPSHTGTDTEIQFGPTSTASTWIPVVGDWTGTHKDQVGLYDQTTATFHLDENGVDVSFLYGPTVATGNGLQPIAGKWIHGATTDTVGLYQASTSVFFLHTSNTTGTGEISFLYGSPTNQGGAQINWKPLAADWTGSGTDTIGLYDPAASMFFLRNSNDSGIADRTFMYGPANFQGTPLAGTWNAEPTAASVSSTTPAGTYGPTTSIPITVTFSDPVTVTGTPKLVLNSNGSNASGTALASYTSGSGTSTLTFTYTVAAGDSTATGAVLDYASTTALTLNGGTIVDAAGNAALLTLPAPASINDTLAAQAIVITAAPTGVSTSTATGTYGPNDTVTVTVTFSDAVTVDTTGGTPTLALTSGGTANYTGGNGTFTTLTFTYTVGATDSTSGAALDYTSTGALALNGATIVDAAGNAALLTLPAPASINDTLAAQGIIIT